MKQVQKCTYTYEYIRTFVHGDGVSAVNGAGSTYMESTPVSSTTSSATITVIRTVDAWIAVRYRHDSDGDNHIQENDRWRESTTVSARHCRADKVVLSSFPASTVLTAIIAALIRMVDAGQLYFFFSKQFEQVMSNSVLVHTGA